MKKALISYFHGVGDCILLTPHMRHLHNKGHMIDLMCRQEVIDSHLFDLCPYINKLIAIPNPWDFEDPADQLEKNNKLFDDLSTSYDWSGVSNHDSWDFIQHKMDMTAQELGIELEDYQTEVFLPEDEYEDGDYLFLHNVVPKHPKHCWEDAEQWSESNLVYDGVYNTSDPLEEFDNINEVFLQMKHAKHRVLCSSVFVHACEAMGLYIDCVNYGTTDRKVVPLDKSKVLRIRENEMFLDRDNRVWSDRRY